MKRSCKAVLSMGDDYGDNPISFRCRLPARHKGKHRETGNMDGNVYMVEWTDTRNGKTKFLDWLGRVIDGAFVIWFYAKRPRRVWLMLAHKVKQARGE